MNEIIERLKAQGTRINMGGVIRRLVEVGGPLAGKHLDMRKVTRIVRDRVSEESKRLENLDRHHQALLP